MPIPYRIDTAEAIIRTHCVGDITLQEVLAHFDEIENDPDCPERLDVLLDFSELGSTPSIFQLLSVTDRIRSAKVRFGSVAIVAKTDLFYGVARMFATLAETQFFRARVFREFLQAEFWLKSVRRDGAT